ncbi:uncharacterized protein LOC105026266 isoform X2 [Esox lucius]|uniref:Ricin B lectin domain-containing protein n=1 Tax=Esox lucius TaxID=8010 RepID=A0A6Q2ZEQ5_ESOLU|nr:uncharacterized protein LOC105026266 isoform X2 [Esox lucius]
MMGNKLFGPCAISLAILVFHEVIGFTIRNELLGKCLQVLPDACPGVGLKECRVGSTVQEWQWLPEGRALGSLHTGKCLSGHERHRSVRMHRCGRGPEDGTGTTGDMGDGNGQAWACSRRGHLTLFGKGLHLTARHVSSEVVLSEERGLASKWRTPGNLTVCSKREDHRHPRPHGSLQSTAQPVSAGFGWEVVMLVLSSMALVLGTVILTLNIFHSRVSKYPLMTQNIMSTCQNSADLLRHGLYKTPEGVLWYLAPRH